MIVVYEANGCECILGLKVTNSFVCPSPPFKATEGKQQSRTPATTLT